ncbi:MAG: hypothetical protein U9N34_10040, partial [Candidatus Cloacimonadota bacterium]|nr:hypothetical protein [Candidatus Cloacimonadota bacterium]
SGFETSSITKTIVAAFEDGTLTQTEFQNILDAWGDDSTLSATLAGTVDINIESNKLLTETTFENFANAFLKSEIADTALGLNNPFGIEPDSEMANFWKNLASTSFGGKNVYSINDFITLSTIGMLEAIGNIGTSGNTIPSSIGISNWPSTQSISGGVSAAVYGTVGIGTISMSQGTFPRVLESIRQASVVTAFNSSEIAKAQAAGYFYLNNPIERINSVWADRPTFDQNIGSFAEGGISTGPETGHLEMLHGTEAIIPLKNGVIPATVNNSDLVREIRALRKEMAATSKKNSKKIKNIESIFDRVTQGGVTVKTEVAA